MRPEVVAFALSVPFFFNHKQKKEPNKTELTERSHATAGCVAGAFGDPSGRERDQAIGHVTTLWVSAELTGSRLSTYGRF